METKQARKCRKFKIYFKYIIIITISIFILINASVIYIYNDMLQHKNISISNHKKVDYIYFYRDNCPKCKRNYPKEFFKKILYYCKGKTIVFVNTKDIKKGDTLNSGLVKKFKITRIPKEIKVNIP